MSKSGFAKDQLRSFIERIERLEEERAALSADILEVYSEAKGTGFDTKAMRAVVRLRKLDTADRQEQEAILDLYLSALGMSREYSADSRFRLVAFVLYIFVALEPQFLELAIERRTSDAEAARDFGHVPVITRDRHANDLGFDFFQLAHVACRVHAHQRIRRGTGR